MIITNTTIEWKEKVPWKSKDWLLKNNITFEHYIRRKKETISTRLSYFLSACGRINLHDDSFPSKSLFKPEKNSQTSLETPVTTQVFISFRDNTICKEGIFSDVLGEKFRRKFKTLTNTCTADD